eukprot:4782381-Prymnesium_polylepis.1
MARCTNANLPSTALRTSSTVGTDRAACSTRSAVSRRFAEASRFRVDVLRDDKLGRLDIAS